MHVDKPEKIRYIFTMMGNEQVVMNSEAEKIDTDDEISLLDLFAVLWRYKIMIIAITFAAAIGVVVYTLICIRLPPEKSPMPNVYTSESFMLIDSGSSGDSLSSILGSAGGMASLLRGVSSSGSSFSGLALFMVETNTFLDSVVDNFNLIEKFGLEQSRSARASSRNIIKGQLEAEYDNVSRVLSISFTDIDPVFARDVVNYSTFYLGQRFDELGLDKNKIEKENLEMNIANAFQAIIRLEEESRELEQSVASGLSYGGFPAITVDLNRIRLDIDAQKQIYTQLLVQYELLKVTMASEVPIFQILEMAEAPELKSGPSRPRLCIIVTLAAGFLSVFMAFAINAVSNIIKDPQAMAKLRGA